MKRRKTSTSTTEKRGQQQREGKGEEEKKKKKRKKSDGRETLSEIGPFRIPNFEEEDALLTARTVAHICREIVKFLLFNRNQIPLMYADLVSLRRVEQKEEEEEDPNEENAKEKTKKKRKRKSSKRSEKKLFNQIAQIERLMESLSEEEFASRQPVKRVAVCFGATVNRPVETYIIDLEDVRYSATRGEGGEEEEAQSEKKTKSAANRIVRAVMPHVAGLRTNPSRTSQKIWIFLKHEDAADNDDESDDEKNALRAELSNRFAMKRNLNGLFDAQKRKRKRLREDRLEILLEAVVVVGRSRVFLLVVPKSSRFKRVSFQRNCCWFSSIK
jgi:hypothetical protein